MQGLPGGVPDPQQLQATMLAIEQACSLIQVHMNPAEAEKVLSSLHSSLMPYQACRFILETSLMPNARFQAAGAIGDAAIREWGILTDDNKRSLILYCLNYVMEHTGSPDGYVQSKVSAVAARLLKRGWLEFPDQEKGAIFFEVEQSIQGMHGPNRQFAGINFLETLDFYCWAQAAVFNTADKILNSNVTIPEEKACSAALRLMLQILSWSFKPTLEHENLDAKIKSGLRSDAINLRKFERSLVKPGSLWTDILISSAHTTWVLNFYTTLRQKYSYDTLWGDSPIAVSCRQLIVQLCSLAGAVFPNDNGDAQIEHFMHILSAVILWIEPPNVIAESIRNGGSESEFIDGCHVLLSVASLTSSSLFDNLLKSIRQYGTINLLSALTSEAVKSVLDNQNEEETWGSDALDILLETWNVILGSREFDHCDWLSPVHHLAALRSYFFHGKEEACADKSPMSADGALAASNLFKIIVESHLKAAADSAFEDSDDAEYFHVSVSKRDEQLALYALIARAAADTTIPFLEQLFSERFARLSQIPEALQAGFTNVVEVAQHPVVTLSWSIINFSRQCLDPGIRGRYFSPRLMEAVIWFLARWVATYLVPLDVSREIDSVGRHGSQHSRKLLNSFAWDNNQGELVLDFVVLMSMVALTTYQGEIELQTLTCQKLLASVVRRKHTCAYVVQLDSWRDLTRAFASGRSLFSLSGRLQRSLAETLACAASCIKDPEASVQYLRDLMGPVAGCLVENASRSDLKSVAHQPDVIYMVCCLLERLRGAARATQPRTQKVLFEMGHTVMNSLLTLLEVYKNQSEVIYMILKFVVDFIDGQAVFLDGKETSVLMSFCLRLLQIYSSHNIGKVKIKNDIQESSENATSSKPSKRTGVAGPNTRQPRLPTWVEAAPHCTAKLCPERSACPLAPGRRAPILPMDTSPSGAAALASKDPHHPTNLTSRRHPPEQQQGSPSNRRSRHLLDLQHLCSPQIWAETAKQRHTSGRTVIAARLAAVTTPKSSPTCPQTRHAARPGHCGSRSLPTAIERERTRDRSPLAHGPDLQGQHHTVVKGAKRRRCHKVAPTGRETGGCRGGELLTREGRMWASAYQIWGRGAKGCTVQCWRRLHATPGSQT
uniref:Exportin-4 n=1 Tax=Aegilops tauschii TaxID=37682 RepID=N1R4N4_AEGTA